MPRGLAPFGESTFRVACGVLVWNDEEKPPRELPRAVVVQPDGQIAAIEPHLDPVRLRQTLTRVGAADAVRADAA